VLIKKEDKKNLACSLNELSDDSFEFVYERYYEDMSYEAIAEKHGLSREAAKKRVYRSVDKLKEIFERKEKTNDKTVY
jgi:RNA polymerase sigma factor (sigma-70 family)